LNENFLQRIQFNETLGGLIGDMKVNELEIGIIPDPETPSDMNWYIPRTFLVSLDEDLAIEGYFADQNEFFGDGSPSEPLALIYVSLISFLALSHVLKHYRQQIGKTGRRFGLGFSVSATRNDGTGSSPSVDS
jgi:hypothetical protein